MGSWPVHVRKSVFHAAGACAEGFADLLLPAVCGACGRAGPLEGGLCGRCRLELLSLVAVSSCPRCGGSLGPNVPARPDGCGQCHSTLPRFARTYRLGPYAGCLRRAIRDLKYRRNLRLRGNLTRLLAERIRAAGAAGAADNTDCDTIGPDAGDAQTRRPEVVLAVPMHWLRRLGRGFDHARAIAAGLARELDLPLGCELVRVRNTPPQVNLPRTRRLENVRGAFAVRSTASIAGADVLLVDDVTTTGATADEASRVLLAAGAQSVTLAVLAKAEPPAAYAHCRT